MSLTPLEYEQLCASTFDLCGWIVRTTAVSGDQGADIIAESGKYKLVVQCKQYSQPVGNSAVQEVIAARVYYQANAALVVSNAPFTKSAFALAESADVHLLHHTKLRAWAEQHRAPSTRPSMSLERLIAALNVRGFATRQTSEGAYSVQTPGGLRYARGAGALTHLAEQLLDL